MPQVDGVNGIPTFSIARLNAAGIWQPHIAVCTH